MRRFAPKFRAFLDKNKLMKTRIAHIILLLSFALFVGPVYGSTNGVPSDSEISAISAEPYAASDPIVYKVTIYNGSTVKELLVEDGSVIEFYAIAPDDCHSFVRWKEDGNTSEYRTHQVKSNITFTAVFETMQFKVTVSVDPNHLERGTVTVRSLQ